MKIALHIIAVAALALGCGDATSTADASLPADAGADAGALSDAGAPDAGPAECRTVAVTSNPGADWACPDSNSCKADYLAFPAKAAAYEAPTTDAALNQALTDIEAGKVAVLEEAMAPAALRDAILDRLNMRFLAEGIDGRPLAVTVTGESETADYRETDLLFVDEYVGTFKGILLTPKAGGPFPGIVAVHGHGGDAADYRDHYHGAEFPSHGYAILMLTMRAMNIDADEHEVTWVLLLKGFNLISLRVYESLLGLRYLACRPDVLPGKIGLIGHSGGSSTGNLTVRIEPRFKAFVSDNQVDWYKSSDTEPYHCETAPALYPYHDLINDFTTSQAPVLQVPYGYITGMSDIWKFYRENLK